MQTEDALNFAELLSYYESYGGYMKIAGTPGRHESPDAR